MNMAFEVTVEDVMNCFKCDEDLATELFDMLDCDAVADAALYGDDMDSQTEYAYDEIKQQLKSEFNKLQSEIDRRDEKNGLYGGKEDIAN
jgi:hypothetical protein